MGNNYKVLVIDDNPDLREIISFSLKDEGFIVSEANGAVAGIDQAVEENPDLIILDVMLPDMDGFEVCAILKAKRETADIPVIFLSARDQLDDKIKGLNIGGVDYIAKPFKSEELIARIKSLLRSRDHDVGLNPLSKLPGNKLIQEKLKELVKTGTYFAVGYLDIDKFKTYNDKHGFFEGDKVLLQISKTITEAMTKYGEETDFVGHIGGDDFIFITMPDKVEKICEEIIRRFEKNKYKFYNTDDFNSGFIESVNRIGVISKIPLMTISIAVVSNEQREFKHPAEIATIAAELKQYLKSFSESNYKIDRRVQNKDSLKIHLKRKIMIIEPDSKIAGKFDKALNKNDVFIRFVENGASALLLMDSLKPDIILMNSHLPLIDGLTLFGQIKKEEKFKQIPVYIYSNLPFDRLILKGEVNIPHENFLDLNDLDNHLERILKES